ncbi:unnamed protein product, partial [Ectocarpus fasciculatus]
MNAWTQPCGQCCPHARKTSTIADKLTLPGCHRPSKEAHRRGRCSRVVAGALALAALGFCLRRRRAAKSTDPDPPAPPPSGGGSLEH